MPFRLGPWELVLVLVIALLIFGPGRIGKIGGELGRGISAFKKGLQGDQEESKTDLETS
jgi:sec-independent protein translocase protein TatA